MTEKNFYLEINQKIQEQINKMLEEKSITEIEFLDDDTTIKNFIDTGFASLNYIICGDMENGGYPVGRITEIAGDPSTGKTLLATIAAISSLKKGYITYYLDGEQAYDVNFAKLIAKTLGLDPEIVKKINYKEIDKIEELTQVVTTIIDVFEKNKVDTGATIIVDGIAFLSTTKEIEDVMKNEEKVDMTKAKLIRQFIRVIKNKLKYLNICMIITNQLTYNIGVMYGDPKTTTGGTAIPFASSVRLRIKSKKIEDNDGRFIGLLIKAETQKNRLFFPYKEAEFPVLFNGKLNKFAGLFETLFNDGIIEKENNLTYKIKNTDIKFLKKDFNEIVIQDENNFKTLLQTIEKERKVIENDQQIQEKEKETKKENSKKKNGK